MATSACRILWTGDAEHHEFRELLEWLTPRAVVTRQTDIAQAAAYLTDSTTSPHDLVIVAQSRSGQFPQSSLERLHWAAPLTPIVAALGSWCEGDARSGIPWKGIPRIYWHQLRSQLARGLTASNSSAHSRWPEWQLPRTTTDAERSLHASEQPLLATNLPPDLTAKLTANPTANLTTNLTANSTASGLTRSDRVAGPTIWLIRAACVSKFETLADTLRLIEIGSVWWPVHRPAPPCQGMRGILWDADQLDDFEWSRLQEHFQAAHKLPVIVLAGFLRRHEQQRLIGWGVAGVVTKPFWIENLLHEILHASHPKYEARSSS